VRFIVDAQLPAVWRAPSLSRDIRPKPYATWASAKRMMSQSGIYAAVHQMIIVTKDEDFAARVWQTSSGPPIIWLRMGNCSNQALLEHLLPLLDDIIERVGLGDRLIEVS